MNFFGEIFLNFRKNLHTEGLIYMLIIEKTSEIKLFLKKNFYLKMVLKFFFFFFLNNLFFLKKKILPINNDSILLRICKISFYPKFQPKILMVLRMS